MNDQAKADIKTSTKALLPALGIQYDKRSRKWWCPFCKPDPNSKHGGSMGLHKNGLKCFRCGYSADVIKLYMDTRSVDFKTAIEHLSGGDFQKSIRYAKLEAFTAQPKIKQRRFYPNADSAIASLQRGLVGYYVYKTWTYHEMDGSEFMLVVRFNHPTMPKEYRPITKSDKGWFIGKADIKIPIYNLPAIVNSFDETVFVTEGEKAADAAISIGLLATCCAGGAMVADKSDWEPLKNRRVIVLPDNDMAGETFALDIKKLLPQSTIWNLPNLPPKGDIADWVEARKGRTKEELLAELRKLWKERA